MAEVLVEFDAAFPGADGATYAPRVCARVRDDGLWEGWLEFTDIDTGAVVRSARETTQPVRADVMYWATGLTRVYIEGALARTLGPASRAQPVHVTSVPAFDGPAPRAGGGEAVGPRAVLDPFEVFAQGEKVLRQELSALDLDHLRAIVQAYGLEGGAGADSPLAHVVIEYIIAEVRSALGVAGA
jgi:hypothetical protein